MKKARKPEPKSQVSARVARLRQRENKQGIRRREFRVTDEEYGLLKEYLETLRTRKHYL